MGKDHGHWRGYCFASLRGGKSGGKMVGSLRGWDVSRGNVTTRCMIHEERDVGAKMHLWVAKGNTA